MRAENVVPRRLAVTAVFLLSTFRLIAQVPSTPPGEAVRSSGVTLTTTTQLVQVDIVVQDANGHAVHGLKLSDFQLAEDKKPQTVKNFEEHIAVDPKLAKAPAVVKLSPGTFTDYTPVPENAPLTVILLDRLNTPMDGQTYVLQQLRDFLKKIDPNTRVAIFGLTSKLHMLQGFTADPAVLLAALDHKIGQQQSVLLPSAGTTNLSDAMTDAGAPASAIAEEQQFEAESASFQTQLRIEYTLTAFNQLAGYLSGFPGRKNLLWLSGSFPIYIDPDPTIQYKFNTEANFTDQFKKTTNLLARARVAVYPVDANGLQTNPMFAPSAQGKSYPMNSAGFMRDTDAFSRDQQEIHNTMNNLANDTGGHAFYNNNDLVGAFTQSLSSGSDYYTLTYSPTNHDDRGGFRSIHVALQGPAQAQGLKLAYRRGYYLDDTRSRNTHATTLAAENTSAPAVSAYAMAVMQHGAPAPSDILFKVRVLPVAPGKEDATTSRRVLTDDKHPPQNYEVDFTTLATKLDVPLQADGKRHGAVEFVIYAYDAEGKLLHSQSKVMTLNLTPENYTKLLKGGIGYSQQMTAPTKTQSFRIAVHDLTSGQLGVVEVPLSAVSHLAPATPTN
jgi:VWFA-related protein